MERENFDVDEIPVIMDIRPYMFEHIVLNNNEENMSTSSEESKPKADRYWIYIFMSEKLSNPVSWVVIEHVSFKS